MSAASNLTEGGTSGQTPAVLTKEELLGSLPDTRPTKRIDGPFGGSVIIAGLVDNSDLCKLIEKVKFRDDHRVPETQDIPATCIEQVTWLEFCAVEPELSFDDALAISRKAGWWLFNTYIQCQQLSGVRAEQVQAVIEDLKQDPFASNTSEPASEDSTDTPKK